LSILNDSHTTFLAYPVLPVSSYKPPLLIF